MSSSSIQSLLHGTGQRSLLLDSNLLVLWLTARYDIRLMATFKRVQMFSQQDAVLLAWIVDQYDALVTTAHIAAETSNLGNSLSSYTRSGWFGSLAAFCLAVTEDTPTLAELAAENEWFGFGIADCALSSLSANIRYSPPTIVCPTLLFLAGDLPLILPTSAR